MPRRPSLSAIYLLLLFLIGLGYIAIMPLFEGIDETAHFSSMRQIADTKTLPVYGQSYVDKEALEYKGPTYYGSLHPPFDTGMVYRKFFTYPQLVADYPQSYREPHLHQAYTPSDLLNWQAQHPPLYYLIMAPLEKETDRLSFVTQIFLLRVISYLIALAGVGFALLAVTPSKRPEDLAPGMLGLILYPILLPGFFPEFARIGNDSLCLFLIGLIALLFSRWLQDEDNLKWPVAMGIALGLGLITKAFFVPITATLVMLLVLRTWRRGSPRQWLGIVCMALPTLAIGIGWYIYQMLHYGNSMAGNDASILARQGGLLLNLKKNLTLFSLARGIVAPFVSWIWAGTWSLAHPHPVFYLPLILLIFWTTKACLADLKRRSLFDTSWLPVWLVIIFGAGMAYHVLIGIALVGAGNTGGWYLHILMPWVAPALGLGFCSIWRSGRARYALIGLYIYAILFQAGVLWAQFAMFTGCASKGDDKYYLFPDHSFCLAQAPQLVDRLAVLGWPALAAIGFGGAALCGIWLFVSARKDLHHTGAV